MKHFFIAMMALVILATGEWIWAQNKPVSAGAPSPSKAGSTTQNVSTGPTLNSAPKTAAPGSNAQSVNARVMAQKKQIKKDLKSGKMTRAQAQAAWDSLKTIKKQELEFMRQNGQKEITDDQKNQLNTQLDQTNGSI